MDKLSMSLDDIIKNDKGFSNVKPRRGVGGRTNNYSKSGVQNKSNFGGKSRGNRFSNNRFTPYNRGNVDSQWTHDLFEGSGGGPYRSVPNPETDITKLLVSNLEFGVSDFDLVELFTEFGTLISAEIHYDRSGRSLGTADVFFKNRASAVRAVNFYNGVPLDGRPMHIQIVDSSSQSQNTYRPGRSRGGRGRGRGYSRNTSRGIGGSNRNNRSNRNGNLTAEQLDAELDSYVNGG